MANPSCSAIFRLCFRIGLFNFWHLRYIFLYWSQSTEDCLFLKSLRVFLAETSVLLPLLKLKVLISSCSPSSISSMGVKMIWPFLTPPFDVCLWWYCPARLIEDETELLRVGDGFGPGAPGEESPWSYTLSLLFLSSVLIFTSRSWSLRLPRVSYSIASSSLSFSLTASISTTLL